jgi:hypothetical protein
MRGLLTAGVVCLATLMAGAAAAKGGGGRCVVEGKKSDPLFVDVTPRDAAPFKLRVAGVPAAAMPEVEGHPARVEVRGPIAFEGTAPADKLPWKTARQVDAMNGMVRLAPATEGLILHATAFARVVEAEVQLGPVKLRGLSLPCNSLTLDPVKAPEPRDVSDEGESFVAAGNKLHLRSAAGSGHEIDIELGEDSSVLDLHRLESSGAWVRVSTHWADGTTVVGWVKRDELKPAAPRHEPLGEPFGSGAACTREVQARPGERLASARIAAGTSIYAARFIGAWGTLKSAGTYTVRFLPKDDWVSLVSVPGIVSAGECPEHSVVLDEAWVPRQSVQLPKDDPPTAPTDGGT